ncbi:MAG TPA: hypothetical protein VHU44_04025 [Acidobacteriaceae bacterium]|jgi:hypothetical protein|nr:hypothetical protein [Acidobacteriaceae bacterium]
MRPTGLLISTLAIALLGSTGSAFAQYYGPPPAQHWQGDAERDLERRGYQDGVIGADRDFQNHRRADVNNRDEFRDPHFGSAWAQQEYREGFRRGYYMRVRQIYGDAPGYEYRGR